MRCGVRDTRQPKPPLIAPNVDDRRRASIAVLGVLLPARDPLTHRAENVLHPENRVLVILVLAERGVDEVALRRDAQPERAEVSEHELALRRLADDAHVGDAAVPHEMARACRIAPVFSALRIAPLRLLDLATDRRDHHVTLQGDPGVAERTQRLDVAGQRALHIRDPEPVEAAVFDERVWLEAGHVREPGLAARVRRVHMTVEHQRRAAARAGTRTKHVRATLLHLLPLGSKPHIGEGGRHQLGHLLLAAGEARHVDRLARPADEPLTVDCAWDAVGEGSWRLGGHG